MPRSFRKHKKVASDPKCTRHYNSPDTRLPEIQMQQFVAEFEEAYNKVKRHGMTSSNDFLGFKLLKAANLPHFYEQLIKATITEVSYDKIIK